MNFLLLLLCALLFVQSFVTAVDHRQAVYDVVASNVESSSSKANQEEEPQHAANRRKRVRRTIAVDASSPIVTEEAVDPFNNYMVLAENEDALVRALNAKTYGSVPPPKSYSGVSTSMARS
jgi:hypothetical protein